MEFNEFIGHWAVHHKQHKQWIISDKIVLLFSVNYVLKSKQVVCLQFQYLADLKLNLKPFLTPKYISAFV